MLPQNQDEPKEYDFATIERQMNQAMLDDHCDSCEEEVNQLWFQQFIAFQDEGYTLDEADELAMLTALKTRSLCFSTSWVYSR